MKKKNFMLSCIAAVAIAIFVGKKTFESKAFESDALFVQNVEALSDGDNSGMNPDVCYNSIVVKKGSLVIYCTNCSIVEGAPSFGAAPGKCSAPDRD